MDRAIYEKNMKAFHARYDYVAKQIEGKDYELTEELTVSMEEKDLIRAEKNGVIRPV